MLGLGPTPISVEHARCGPRRAMTGAAGPANGKPVSAGGGGGGRSGTGATAWGRIPG